MQGMLLNSYNTYFLSHTDSITQMTDTAPCPPPGPLQAPPADFLTSQMLRKVTRGGGDWVWKPGVQYHTQVLGAKHAPCTPPDPLPTPHGAPRGGPT